MPVAPAASRIRSSGPEPPEGGSVPSSVEVEGRVAFGVPVPGSSSPGCSQPRPAGWPRSRPAEARSLHPGGWLTVDGLLAALGLRVGLTVDRRRLAAFGLRVGLAVDRRRLAALGLRVGLTVDRRRLAALGLRVGLAVDRRRLAALGLRVGLTVDRRRGTVLGRRDGHLS